MEQHREQESEQPLPQLAPPQLQEQQQQPGYSPVGYDGAGGAAGQAPVHPQQQQQQQQPGYSPAGYDGAGGAAGQAPVHPQQQLQQQQQPPPDQNMFAQAPMANYGGYGPPPASTGVAMPPQTSVVSTPPPAQPVFNASASEKATQLLAACESCLVVTRIPGFDMSFRRIMESRCLRCNGTLVLPQEIMEMLILYGHYIPETVATTVLLGTMALHPALRPDFVASAMNELLIPLQTDFVYDVAVPKRPEGLGMSLRMHQGDLAVGGFVDFDGNTESPSVAARIIAVGDVLVAINKKGITSWSFEKSIRMLANSASPVYLTFRRVRPVTIL